LQVTSSATSRHHCGRPHPSPASATGVDALRVDQGRRHRSAGSQAASSVEGANVCHRSPSDGDNRSSTVRRMQPLPTGERVNVGNEPHAERRHTRSLHAWSSAGGGNVASVTDAQRLRFVTQHGVCDLTHRDVCDWTQRDVCDLTQRDVCDSTQRNACDLTQRDGCDLTQHDGCDLTQHDGCDLTQHDGCDLLRKAFAI
jgi:hypothetical protein